MRDPIDNRGFSLIETLIACALLATALLSVGHLSTAAIVLLMDFRGRTQATPPGLTQLEHVPAPALLPVGHLSTAAIVLLMDSRGRTEATLLALTKLEELRSSAAPAAGAD